MDRDNELEEEYKTTNYKEFVRQEIESRRVPGEWYILEQGTEKPKIIRGLDGQLAGAKSADGSLVEIPCSFERARELGWTVTPVDIFKKE